MKKIYCFFTILLFLIPIGVFAQSYPLRVVITNKANFTQNIGDFKENPSRYLNVSVVNNLPNSKEQNIYFELKLKRISPTQDVSIFSNKYIRPVNGIAVKANSNKQITPNEINDNFATHSLTDFTISGVEINPLSSFSSFSDAYKLPEGIYQLCLIAYDFEVPFGGEPIPLSDPDASCTSVKVCYKANSPKWLEPVNCVNDINCYDKLISPNRMIRFSWTPLQNTCGIDVGVVDYDVKLYPIYEGQTPDEAALINPPKYIWEKVKNTNLTVDTTLLQNVFVQGEKYALQVSVGQDHILRIREKLELENEGVSKTVSFIYGEKKLADNKDDEEKKEEDTKKPKLEQDIDKNITLAVTNVDCGIPLPANQKLIDNLNPKDEVMIDKFPLIITEVKRNDSTKLFKGKGIIRKPIVGNFEYFNWVNVMVDFDSLAVNTDKQAFGGFARATYSNKLNTDFKEFFRSFESMPNWVQKYCGLGADKAANQAKSSAKKYVEKFQGEANMVMQMFNLSYQTLPIKISHSISGYSFDVAISDMKFTPKGSAFSMLYFLKVPEVDYVLPFGMKNICMNGNPVQNGEFCLLADVEIPLGSSNKTMIIKGGESSIGNRTYVKWSNKGFEGVRLEAALRFAKGSGISNADQSKQFIDVSLSTDFVSWGDWVADINMDEFKIDAVPDFTFNVKNAVYDHSTKRNHEHYSKAVEALSKYDDELIDSKEYTGVFFGELSCKAKLFASDEPIEFGVYNTLFSSKGISFSLESRNLLNLETGNAGGWQFSIDELKMVLVKNVFREGSMNGQMKVPLNENESAMKYSSVLSYPKGGSLQYKLNVVPTISYNFLKYFTASLDESSSIEMVANKQDGVIVTGKFNGKVSTRNCKLKLDLVDFQGMTISNWDKKKNKKDFVFNIGNWGFGGGLGKSIANTKGKAKKSFSSGSDNSSSQNQSNSKATYKINIGPFEGSVGKLSFYTNDLDASSATNLSKGLQKAKEKGKLKGKTFNLKVPVNVNIGFGDKKIAGGGVDNVFSYGVLYDASFKSAPKLDKFNYKVDQLRLRGEFGVVSLEGTVGFFDGDAVYGDGAGGRVSCEFPMGMKADAEILFGKKEKSNGKTSKYFCVNGAAHLGSASIPLADPIVISGFGAGVWKNMVVNNTDTNDTGFRFVPVDNEKETWGFKGQLLFGLRDQMGGKNTLTGAVELEGSFENGGLNELTFKGDVAAMGHFSDGYMAGLKKKLNKLSKALDGVKSDYCVNGGVKMTYNHTAKQFSLKSNATADLFLASANAYLEIYVDGKNKKWYVAAGKPMYENKDSVISVESSLDLKVVTMHSAIKGYIIAGNNLNYTMPPIPEKILKLVREKPSRAWPKRASAGFMMGCRFSFNFDFNFGPLFASLDAMLGFDMSFRNEKGKNCADGRPIKGIKGYYLRGQLYAYLSGKIGVQLKFFGKRRRWNLCAITCAGYLKGGLPSPTYLKGAVGVQGEILGGLIKFNTNAKFTLGSECKAPAPDLLKDFILVDEITPGHDNSSEANNEPIRQRPSIFVAPKARFTVLLNKPFSLYSDDVKRTYIFRHHSAKLTNVNKNTTVSLSYDTQNTISGKNNTPLKEITYKFKDRLEPNTLYRFEIQCRVREINKYNYEVLPLDEYGNSYTEDQTIVSQTVYFVTSVAPNRIEVDNIKNAYPYDRQFETFVRDGEKGYIVLQYSQKELINNKSITLGERALFGYFKNRTNRYKRPIPFTYKYENRNVGGVLRDVISFDLSSLDKGSIYEVEFYVAEKYDEAAKYKIVTNRERVAGDAQFDDDQEYGDQDVIMYTGFVNVDKFKQNMQMDTTYAGSTSNSANHNNSSKETWNTPEEYERYLNSLNYNEGNNNINKEKNRSAYYNTKQTSFNDKSELDKTKNVKTKGVEKAVIRRIFNYYFRTSNYNSIEEKMNQVYTDYSYDMTNIDLSWTSYRQDNGASVKIQCPVYMLDVVFPAFTTMEEAFGGKAFEESSNAQYNQSNFSLRTDVGMGKDWYNVAYMWQQTCMPFLNSIKSNCEKFYLPFTMNYTLNMNTYNRLINNFDWYSLYYSNKKSDFEGRLTYDEIKSGRINRKDRRCTIAWLYVHHRIFYLHLAYAGKVADEFVNSKIGKRNYFYPSQLSNAPNYIRLEDSFYDKSDLLFRFRDFTYKASSLLYDATNKHNRTKYWKSHFDGAWVDYNKKYDDKIRYLRKTTTADYDFLSGGHSTLFALSYLWNAYFNKKGYVRFDWNGNMYYPIGRHNIYLNYTKPVRFGYPSTKEKLLRELDLR